MSNFTRKTKEEIFELITQVAKELYPDQSWSGLRIGSFEWLIAKIQAEISDLNGQYLD